MTLHEFRQKLVTELANKADQWAIDNGGSQEREFGEYRKHAGIVAGLRMAAMVVDEFLKRDDDGEDSDG
jgi:hypothetical protein